MISLVRLLKEVQGAPKAIILAGAPGAGKSSVIDDVIRDLGLKVMNIDDFFIKNLRDAGISLDLKKADAEGRSGAAKAMASAQKLYQDELAQEIGSKGSIVIDGTAASYNKTYINQPAIPIFCQQLAVHMMLKPIYTQTKTITHNKTSRIRYPSVNRVQARWRWVTKHYASRLRSQQITQRQLRSRTLSHR